MKNELKSGFVFYTFSTVAVATQFMLYMIGSPQAEYMDTLGWLFYTTAALSHAAIIALLPYALSCLALLIGRNGKVAGIVHVALASFVSAFLYVNGNVFALYRQHINGMMLSLFFGEGSSEIFQFDASLYIKTTVAIIAIIGINILLKILSVRLFRIKPNLLLIPTTAVFLVTFIFSNFTHAYAAVAQRQSVVKSAAYLPYFFPLTATDFMLKIGVIEQSDLLKVDFGKQTGLCYPRNPITAESDTLPNIVIIAIDAWNYRTFDSVVLPNICRFANDNQIFTNHLSSSNGTRGSIFGMFFGASSYYWNDFDISGTTPVMIDQMQNDGYQIKAFASATLNSPNFHKLLFRKVPDIQAETEGKRAYDRDCRITTEFIDFIDTAQTDRPFFTFLFYDLAHSFRWPKEVAKKFTPAWDFADYTVLKNDTDPTLFWNLYLNCLNQIDSLIGVVLSNIESHNLLDNTYIIITGDHGQEFNDNHKNYWGHGSNYTYTQIRVPMILHMPGCQHATFTHRTTHYDIPTTILHDVLGVKNPTTDYSMGLPLSDTTFRNWHLVGDNLNYAFIIENKTIVEKKPSGMLEISDSVMNPIKHFKINAKELSDAIDKLNMFYE